MPRWRLRRSFPSGPAQSKINDQAGKKNETVKKTQKKKPVSFVTGAAGFIGSHVAEHLLEMGHRVVALDDLSGGYKDNLPKGVEFIKGSILDHKLIDSLF